MTRLRRFGVFNVVGAIGVAVQLGGLWLLVDGAGLHYLAATGLATEAAVLHNFAWHRAWTWRDRRASRREWGRRLGRFHLANGLVSVAGNIGLMAVLAGGFGIPYLPANLIALAACAALNFLASDDYVFRAARAAVPPRPAGTGPA
jgi:putative flippase GtrA